MLNHIRRAFTPWNIFLTLLVAGVMTLIIMTGPGCGSTYKSRHYITAPDTTCTDDD